MANARTYIVHLRTDGDSGNGADNVQFTFGAYAQAKYHMDIMAVTGQNIWSLCIEHPCGKFEYHDEGHTRSSYYAEEQTSVYDEYDQMPDEWGERQNAYSPNYKSSININPKQFIVMIHTIITYALVFGLGACIGGYITTSIIENKVMNILKELDK